VLELWDATRAAPPELSGATDAPLLTADELGADFADWATTSTPEPAAGRAFEALAGKAVKACRELVPPPNNDAAAKLAAARAPRKPSRAICRRAIRDPALCRPRPGRLIAEWARALFRADGSVALPRRWLPRVTWC
jgi:hypothetical protein